MQRRTGQLSRAGHDGRRRLSSAVVVALAVACVAGLSGCAGGAVSTQGPVAGSSALRAADGSAGPFVRDVAPFPVVDESGSPLSQPFLGGFNVPRPQFVDIDADGDRDLFVQESTGEIRFFEDVGDRRYVWRTDRYEDLEIGEWYRFADLDADGDYDLLGEQRFSHIRVYLNVGSVTEPRFELAADSLRDASGVPIYSDRQNIPNLVDIDCDGRLDLFLGQVTGTVRRFESVGTDERGLPLFELQSERWEDIEIIGQMVSRHGANTLSFGDVDQDGDLDLFWGDFFEPGVLMIRNRGTCAAPNLRGEHEAFPPNDPLATSGYNAPAPADLDGDGDLDMAVGVLGGAFNANASIVENLYLLMQDGPNDFSTRTSRLIETIDVGSDSVPRLFDLDGDGDLDLLLANKILPDNNQAGRVVLFENVGTPTAPSFAARGVVPLAETFHQTPAPGDLDGDGDADLLVGRWNKQIDRYVAENGSFGAVAQPFLELTRGSNSSPALVDIDADGDLDLIAGEASGTLNFWRNEGTAAEADFRLVSDEWNGWRLGRRTVPVFADLDGDGDQDLLVGTELSGVLRFENVGTPQQALYEERGALPVATPALSAPAVGDLDGDGHLDLLIGGISGGLIYYRGTGGKP